MYPPIVFKLKLDYVDVVRRWKCVRWCGRCSAMYPNFSVYACLKLERKKNNTINIRGYTPLCTVCVELSRERERTICTIYSMAHTHYIPDIWRTHHWIPFINLYSVRHQKLCVVYFMLKCFPDILLHIRTLLYLHRLFCYVIIAPLCYHCIRALLSLSPSLAVVYSLAHSISLLRVRAKIIWQCTLVCRVKWMHAKNEVCIFGSSQVEVACVFVLILVPRISRFSVYASMCIRLVIGVVSGICYTKAVLQWISTICAMHCAMVVCWKFAITLHSMYVRCECIRVSVWCVCACVCFATFRMHGMRSAWKVTMCVCFAGNESETMFLSFLRT